MAELLTETDHPKTFADEQTSRDEFVPEKVDLQRRGARRGKSDEKPSVDGKQAGHNIHSSVDFADNNSGGNNMLEEDDTLFSEIDELCPHDHEGGEIAKEPNPSFLSSYSVNSCQQLKVSYRSYAASFMQSTKRSKSPGSNNITPPRSQRPTNDLQALFDDADNGGTLLHKRSSIVGGKQISDMTFDEKREIFAPERSRGTLLIIDDHESDKNAPTQGLVQSITSRSSAYAPIISGGGETTDGMVSSIDWSSLTKSCKRAKESMRDAESSHVVVKNMFLTHFTALTTVLILYTRRYTERRRIDSHVTMKEVLTRTIETRRALRFAISCLAPSRTNSDLYDESAKRARQELQIAAVEGKCLPRAGVDDDNDIRRQGLHVSLAKLIVSGPMSYEHMTDIHDSEKCEKNISSLENNQLSVRTLAARLLCNLVTDNPAAAATVLLDIPFSPTPAQLEERMSIQVLSSNTNNNRDDAALCWSDFIHAVSQIQTIKQQANNVVARDADREVLAAVVAALHNLLVSMETRDTLLDIASEMKRIEKLKQLRNKNRSKIIEAEEEEDVNKDCGRNESHKPIDALFEAASSPALVNALLRSTLPATTILKMLQPAPTSANNSSRPKFVPPKTDSAPVDDASDSATEWISFVLERLVSRGLMLQVIRSAGGKGEFITPEQVVFISCIRQAVDAYQSSLPSATESGEFDMRRLSITAKSTSDKCPHPLWGRGDGLRTAVPVLHFLANEVDRMRLRALKLQFTCDGVLSTEEYQGELNCTKHIIHDIRDILAQCLGKSSSQAFNDQCILTEARSVLGRETTLIANCCEDLARIVDVSSANNSGKSARELNLSSDDQETAISTVRLIGNLVYQCQYNQDLLRSTLVVSKSDLKDGNSSGISRTGLHVLLSATSLGHACFTIREWCIVAIRNAVENNEANIEMVRGLEANEALGDTPELKKLGVKVDLDDKGNVRVQKR